MNRRTGLALILALFILALGCTAFAAGKLNAPFVTGTITGGEDESYSRVQYDTEEEIHRLEFVENSYTYSEDTGLLSAVIDDDATDWKYILANGGGLSYLNACTTVYSPSAEYTMSVSWNGDLFAVSESEMQDMLLSEIYGRMRDFEDEINNNNMTAEEFWDDFGSENYWSHNLDIGEIMVDQSNQYQLIPINHDAQNGNYDGAYLCWFNAEKLYNLYKNSANEASFISDAHSKVFFEHFFTKLTHTKSEPFDIPVRLVTTYCLEPTKNVVQDACITLDEASLADDEITFIGDPAKYTGDESEVPVYIKIRPPKELEGQVTFARLISGWGGDPDEAELGNDGTFTFSLNYHINDMQVEEYPLTIAYYSYDSIEDSYSREGYGAFFCHIKPAEVKPWPAYVLTNNPYRVLWAPAAKERVGYADDNTGGNLSYDAATGILHSSFDSDANLSGEPAPAYVWVEAPAGANYYRSNRSTGNNIMGLDMHAAEEMDRYIMSSAADTGSNNKTIMDYPLLRSVQAGPVKVYLQNEFDWLYGGSVNVIYWYKNADDATPFMIEYLIETMDEFFMIERTDCVPSEDMITAPVENITVIGEECAAMNWNLVIRHDLQNGVNAVHYELYLEDDDGNYQRPTGEKMVFYVPYPDGTGMNTGHEFQLLHFNGSYSYSENVAVSLTPYGVRFEVTSLSPFTLSWGNAFTGGNASELPPTGDNTPIALYAILMLSAAIGLMVSRRKIRG